jgi:dipeptidyl aminopeptidase/acylaminoacyl peptidase
MIALLSFALAALGAADTHPFGVHDMLAMQRISGTQVSPDGKSLVFEVRTTDLTANRGRLDLWTAPLTGGEPRALTTHEANDNSPRFAPDGQSVFFLSSRSGSSQVWRLPLGGGEALQVTSFPIDVDNFLVFPDGKRLLLTMEVLTDAPLEKALEDTAARDAQDAASKVKARVYDRLLFRHWDNWEDKKRSHAFVWEIGGGAPVDLMPGMDADCPPKPFGGAEELAISPDGRMVAFTARVHTRESAWNTDLHVFQTLADGSVPPRNLSVANQAQDGQPQYSPDGRFLAWLAMARPGYEADRQRIVLLDLRLRSLGPPRTLTEEWDRSPGEFRWSTDSKQLWCTADNIGNHSLYSVDVESGKPTLVFEKGTCANPQPAADGRVVFALDTLDMPAELFSVKADGSDLDPITKLNAERLAMTQRGSFEQFRFAGWNGETVHGFVGKPAGYEAGKRYPVAFLIHGGPQGSFGNHFHYRWNPQAYAGAGLATVFIDFHGSTGYGQAFTDAIRGDWGGKPYEDLMKGLDHALANFDWLDKDRVAALGASYGGFMINWIAGQTDRFRCLVNHDGNLDERMAYFDTEELWFPEWEHGGTPWENPAGYTKHNPIDHVAQWKTPMLVIHGALDFRVVDTQGMSTFTALQRKGIPSKFLWFPDENHWVLKPQNSVLWHQTVLAWIQEWTKAGGSK